MQANFDLFEYAEFLRQRWRVIALASLVAIVISFGISVALPKRYTASASIVIEPPGGVDARTATAVSPVYLESLKTYERFAESDSLFAQAAETFHLERSQAIESLKQRVLKVTKLRDTKLLIIEVTLPDPQLAHQVAEFLARQTVELNRSESRAADSEMMGEWSQQVAAAQTALDRAQQAWAADAQLESVDSLQADLDGMRELHFDLGRQIVESRADTAEYRELALSDAKDGSSRAQWNAAMARATALETQSTNLERAMSANAVALSGRKAERDKLQRALEVAQASSESAVNRLRDIRATAGTRGERLNVIDPGIVPQRPTSPRILLNVLAALFLAMVISAAYLSAVFAYKRRIVEFEPALSRARRAG